MRRWPKERAGRRTVAFPPELVPELRWHLERFSEPGERGLVFVGPKGAPLRRSNFRRVWTAACAKAGAFDLHSMICGMLVGHSPPRPAPA